MNIFFWQNINSIHQAPFLNALAQNKNFNIWLIVEEEVPEHRKEMGWTDPVLQNVKLFLIDNINTYELFLNYKDSIHVFSGIAAFPKVHNVFKLAVKNKARIAILTEPLDFRGKKGFLRKIRGFYYKIKYASSIEFFLAIGHQAIHQFKYWGYDDKKIFPWAYTVSESVNDSLKNESANQFKIIFVGSMIYRKGYDLLLNALQKITKNYQADFFCLAPNQKAPQLDNMHTNGQIIFHSFLSNNLIRQKISECDLCILPSRHDGWGAVISESLMEGTPVLVSQECGAAILLSNLENKMIGKIITAPLSIDNIQLEIEERILWGKIDLMERQKIKEWANNKISGNALANYFNLIINYLNDSSLTKPQEPWNNNNYT